MTFAWAIADESRMTPLFADETPGKQTRFRPGCATDFVFFSDLSRETEIQ
jgi:hypothetical protein